MAQSTAVFERIGFPGSTLLATDLAFDGDTLYASFDRSYRRVLGSPDWSTGWELWAGSRRAGRGDFWFDPEGTIYQERRLINYAWSKDRGETWVLNETPAITLPHRTPEGALVTSWNVVGYGSARSEDDGETWTPIPYLFPYDSAIPYEFVSIPTGAVGPAGRIVAAGKPTFAYSDDDGLTWSEVDTVDDQPYSIFTSSLLWVDPGKYLIATAVEFTDAGERDGVFRSEDGETWGRVGQVFEDGTRAILITGGSGALFAWETQSDRVAISTDRGETWTLVSASVSGDENMRISDMEIGPDGHLYAALEGPQSQGGLWRSVEAVAVAYDSSRPESHTPLTLSIYPNPAHDRVEIIGTGFRGLIPISVFDSQGRTVASDVFAPGLPWTLDVPTWSSGIYLVRAGAAGAFTTKSFTVQN